MDTKIKRTSQAGQLELFYEVKITEATISDLSCIYQSPLKMLDFLSKPNHALTDHFQILKPASSG